MTIYRVMTKFDGVWTDVWQGGDVERARAELTAWERLGWEAELQQSNQTRWERVR